MMKSNLTVECPLHDGDQHAWSVTSGSARLPGWLTLDRAARHLGTIKTWLGMLLPPFAARAIPAQTVPELPFMLKSSVALDWQHCSRQLFRAAPGAVGQARRSVRQLLEAWGLADLIEAAELVASELVTNAVTAARALSPAQQVGMSLLRGEASVLMVVWDGDPRLPIRSVAGADDEAGRGLMLVEALSADWGYLPAAGGRGKLVWAVVEGA